MKKVFITGGSGTVGSAFISEFYDQYQFFSFSRNEKMQVALKRNFPKVEILLGSVEDRFAIMSNIYKTKPDIVIHAAAMKHVDSAEKSPIGAVKSNIIGSMNLLDACIEAEVGNTVGISTDKVCSPESTYGQTKYLMEQIFLEAHTDKLKFNIARFGNVAHSHGSVLPFWLRLHAENKPLPLTDKKMNRLMLSQRDAASLVHDAISRAVTDKEPFIMTKMMKSVNMYKLAQLISDRIEIVGLREGEKLDETLISQKEISRTFVEKEFILIRKYENKEGSQLQASLSSKNAEQMSDSEALAVISNTSKILERNSIQNKVY